MVLVDLEQERQIVERYTRLTSSCNHPHNLIAIAAILLEICTGQNVSMKINKGQSLKNKSFRNESNGPPKALFPETETLNLLLGSDDPDYCNFKMVSSWPPCITSKEKRDVCRTCMLP